MTKSYGITAGETLSSPTTDFLTLGLTVFMLILMIGAVGPLLFGGR